MLNEGYRWINDLTSLHLIDANAHLISPALPEEIRKNSLAMEVLSTLSAWSEGWKKDREEYLVCMGEIGEYLDVMLSLAEQEGASMVDLSKCIRVIIATSTAVRALPESHRLKKKLQWRLRSIDRSRIGSEGISIRVGRKGIVKDLERKLWPEGQSVPQGVGQSRKLPPKSIDSSVSLTSNATAIAEITQHFFEILADVLKVDVSSVYRAEVKEEIDNIFSIWRRPNLLLDYHRMHSSTPEIQIVYRRFLKALFGVSNETVDDIRFEDKLNRCHLDRFPPELIHAWREGRVDCDGEIRLLPGYNDPQTLFMLGEDVNTCMSIRSKQKGNNRGLLGFLLHGNCRVVGVKDESGAMLARAIVLLLIDEATYSPVLYMHMPQGDENRFLEVLDFFHYMVPQSNLLYTVGL